MNPSHPPLTVARWARGLAIWGVIGTVASIVVGLAVGAAGPVAGYPASLVVVNVVFAVNVLGWIPSTLRRTERAYDLLGAVSHLVAVGLAWAASGFAPAAAWFVVPVAVWAVRLGAYLATRAHREGDARFDTIKLDPARFALAWSLQALWVCLNTLGVVVAVTRGRQGVLPPELLGPWLVAGLLLWGIGFGIETLADRQKVAFRARPENRGRFVRGGLWSWSRHPNYVGEVLLWTGLFVAGVPACHGLGWLAVLSPVFVYGLLRFGSGVPLLETRADARWGGQPDYEAYKRDVPVFFPWPRPPKGGATPPAT